jgi:chromosomal replication initiation ATPase DnaA
MMFSIDPEAILSADRGSAEISRGRQVAVYLAHVQLQWSLARTAAAFTRKRSTISHACHQVEDLREDLSFDAKLALMEGIISQLAEVSGELGLV